MMTGTTHANAAQLLVSAALGEGIQEQTHRHLWLAQLFGIEQIVVVINKMDLIEYSESVFLKLEGQVLNILTKLDFKKEKIAFVPTSGKMGENVFFKTTQMPWWKEGSYVEVLENTLLPPKPQTNYPMRFSVQSVENGLVVGRVESGALKVRDALQSAPQKSDYRVLEIKGREGLEAKAGNVVGLRLRGNSATIKRGNILIPRVEKVSTKRSFEAKVYILGQDGLSKNGVYTLRAGLQETGCRILKLEPLNPIDPKEKLEEQESAPCHMGACIVLETEKPIFVEPFLTCPPCGRVLLENGGQIAAAGIVL
jgi:sulfate adenylyltransferase subunit 1